jgi:hypothetical protein
MDRVTGSTAAVSTIALRSCSSMRQNRPSVDLIVSSGLLDGPPSLVGERKVWRRAGHLFRKYALVLLRHLYAVYSLKKTRSALDILDESFRFLQADSCGEAIEFDGLKLVTSVKGMFVFQTRMSAPLHDGLWPIATLPQEFMSAMPR